MKLSKSRKGFALNEVPGLAIALVVIAIVLGLGATILDQVKSPECDGVVATNGLCYSCTAYTNITWNSTAQTCYNSTDNSAASGYLNDIGTYSYNASRLGMVGINTMASWEPTWAVIIAAAVVVGIIAAYLMFGRR